MNTSTPNDAPDLDEWDALLLQIDTEPTVIEGVDWDFMVSTVPPGATAPETVPAPVLSDE